MHTGRIRHRRGGKRKMAARRPTRILTLLTIAALVFAGAWVLSGDLTSALLALYGIASIITFGVYGLDKSAARTKQWRTPETTLHVLSLIGGWPGALVAQQVLRHKSSKASFRAVFWITVLINVAVAVWVFKPGSDCPHDGQSRRPAWQTFCR